MKPSLSQAEVKELFEYRDGALFWKAPRQRVDITKQAGFVTDNKYMRVGIHKKLYYLHRLIFLYHYGYMPKVIDHIDGNPLNNKIENLRESTTSQNALNVKLNKRNTSGCKNVTWSKDRNKWIVYVKVNSKATYFGQYDDLELADLVATEARNKYQGEFSRHF